MPRSFPKARDGLTVVHLDGESVVYDDETGDLHHLNTTATVVLDLCDGSSTIAELSARVAGTFGVDRAEVEPAVRSLLRQLRRVRLLEPAGGVRRRSGVS